MNQSQDIPCRRAYLITPNQVLLDKVKRLGDQDLSMEIAKPQVVMTECLPFEGYLEGWRATILKNCKLAFLNELLIEYPIMDEYMAVSTLGSNIPSADLFDLWWRAEEVECLEIPTDWKNE